MMLGCSLCFLSLPHSHSLCVIPDGPPKQEQVSCSTISVTKKAHILYPQALLYLSFCLVSHKNKQMCLITSVFHKPMLPVV